MNTTKKQKKCENGETLTQSISRLTIRQGVKTVQKRPTNCDSILRPKSSEAPFMEKTCPGYNGHPHSERVDPLPRANSASTRSDCLAPTDLTQLCEQKCLYGESCPD